MCDPTFHIWKKQYLAGLDHVLFSLANLIEIVKSLNDAWSSHGYGQSFDQAFNSEHSKNS